MTCLSERDNILIMKDPKRFYVYVHRRATPKGKIRSVVNGHRKVSGGWKLFVNQPEDEEPVMGAERKVA